MRTGGEDFGGGKEAEGGRMGHGLDWFGTSTCTATDIISSSEETTLFCSKNNGQHEFGFISVLDLSLSHRSPVSWLLRIQSLLYSFKSIAQK